MAAVGKGRSLPFARWPATDQALWESLFHKVGLFDDGGRGCRWAPATVISYRQGYGRWLQHCLEHDRLKAAAPLARITPAAIDAFVRVLEDTGKAPHTIASYLEVLRNVAIAADPDVDLWWLTRLVNRLKQHAAPVRPASPPVSIGRLWGAALDQMTRLQRRPLAEPMATAIAYRDALMVALLAFTVVRIKNLRTLSLDRHLVAQTTATWIVVPAGEVKNRRPVERLLPDRLVDALQTYLTVHRPVLLGGRESDRLWISYQGHPLHDHSVRKAVRRTTRRLVGAEVLPHGFRALAVTSIAEDLPGEIDLTPILLEHASARTTERYYNRAAAIRSSRRLGAAYDDLRERLGRDERRRGRPRTVT